MQCGWRCRLNAVLHAPSRHYSIVILQLISSPLPPAAARFWRNHSRVIHRSYSPALSSPILLRISEISPRPIARHFARQRDKWKWSKPPNWQPPCNFRRDWIVHRNSIFGLYSDAETDSARCHEPQSMHRIRESISSITKSATLVKNLSWWNSSNVTRIPISMPAFVNSSTIHRHVLSRFFSHKRQRCPWHETVSQICKFLSFTILTWDVLKSLDRSPGAERQ